MDQPRSAGIYCRISHDPDGRRAGVQRQETDCRKLVEQRGWRLARVYIDNDVSAYSGKSRPEYERLLQDLRAGDVNAVAVWHLDRLHRSPKELEEFLEVCQAAGVRDVATVTGDLDVAESDGLFAARIMTAVSRKASDDSSRRLRRKMEDLALQGKPSGGGRRPFGYEKDGMTVRPSEARVIAEAAERLLRGEGLFGLACEFNSRGIPTVCGGLWTTRTLKRVVLSPRVAGLREYKGSVVGQAAWPAILDQNTHRRLTSVLLDARRGSGSGTARKRLLPGFIYCAECGQRMPSSRSNGKPAYACISGPPYGGCGRVTVVAEPVEELVLESVLRALDSAAFMEAVSRTDATQPALDAAMAQLNEDEAALAQLSDDYYVDKRISRGEFFRARESLAQRIEKTKQNIQRAGSDAVLSGLDTGADAVRRAWTERDLEWRRSLLRQVIARIEIARATKRGRNMFDHNRVRIVWAA